MSTIRIFGACLMAVFTVGAVLAPASSPASVPDSAHGRMPFQAPLPSTQTTSRPVSPLLAKELAVLTNQGLSPARAWQAIRVQGDVAHADLPKKLQTAMGNGFAGVWFDSATAQLHVGVTATASRRTAGRVVAQTGLAPDVAITPVRSTIEQLLAVQKEWNRKLAVLFPHEEVKTGLEPQRNAIFVTLGPAAPPSLVAALKREAAAAGANVLVTVAAGQPPSPVREANECNKFNEAKPNADCNPSITPGVEIWSKISCEKVVNQVGLQFFKTQAECEIKKNAREGKEGEWERKSAECTAGPVGIPVVSKKKRILLTAGHCIAAGGAKAEWFAFKRNLEEPLIGKAGTFVNWGKPEEKKGDFGEIPIEATGGWRTAKPNNPVLAVAAEWKKTAETRYPVKGEREPVAEAMNCHDGATSGEWCGKIKALAVTLKEGELVAEGLVEDEKAISEGGDSGGPWLFVETNNEVLMEGTHVGKNPVKCKLNEIAKEGTEFFETDAACLNIKENREGKKGVWERKLETFWEPLRQPVPGAGEGSLEFLKLELLTKNNERIAPELAASKYPLTFTTTNGESLLETAAGRLVKCKASKGEGEISSTTELKNIVVKFTGCKGKISTLEGPCKSSGAAAEEIVTNKIKGSPVYLNKSKKEAGLVAEPQEAGALYAEFKCESIVTETVKVKGTTLAALTPINKGTTLFTLLAKQEKGKPNPSLYENEEGEKVKVKQETKGEGFVVFGYEESALESTQTMTTAGEVEVVA